MKLRVLTCVVAALLVAGLAVPGYAEEPATPRSSEAPVAVQPQAPSDVPRPTLVPATAAPAAPSAATDVAPRRHRRHAFHRHGHRYGLDHAAYFPVLYWPRAHWPRIHWQRVSWPFRFS